MKKQELYKTAQATASCHEFNAGEFVNVRFYFTDCNGTDWYICWREKGNEACYPSKHLTRLTF